MTTKQHIVFDFDGTIADTLDMAVAIGNQTAAKFNLSPLGENVTELLRTNKTQELLKSLGIKKKDLPKIVLQLRKEMSGSIDKLKMIPGMLESLIEMKKSGYTLGILTSNSRENVRKFLDINNLNELFDFIYSGSNIFGKKAVINRMMKKQEIKHENIVYVGDEIRDVEASHKAGIPVVAVTWGFNSREILETAEPTRIAEEPSDLFRQIESVFLEKR